MKKKHIDPLTRVREIVTALPETSETISHGAPTFWARKRTFMMFADNHHGDGRVAVWCAASKDEQETLVAADPDVCARLEACAPLSYNDGASLHRLSAETFYTESLRIAVASIP